ncbi:aspartate phosphatase [Bacillus velezensis]|uniref:response regulator aspartate phosphatase n=1 Tax=Bacillus velezensis TaxID=492670 RepID=UPI001A91C596|nr:aspartate phosphatase [Bacillus velezensis]BCT30463.1 response regulator aspartate phosphatase K [Bacillus velezensis]
MSKVAPEVVANTLNELHLAIKQHDVVNAEKSYKKTKSMLENMDEDQNVLVYFSLLELRYKMMLYDVKGRKTPFDIKYNKKKLEDLRRTDEMIDYYFYFYEGMYEAYRKNFEEAIGLFKVAEKKLCHIPDEIEVAEFHSKVASLYMHIRQSPVSLGHVNEAINIYKRHPDYKVKLGVAYVIKATNYMHLARFDEAESYYFEAIKISRELGNKFFEIMQFHNISIVYSDSNQSEKCIGALKKVLRDKEWQASAYYINSLYMISREYFKIGDKNKGIKHYKKGLENLNEKENKIYESKLNIVYNLYCKDTKESVDICRRNIQNLVEENDLDGVIDLSRHISKHYEQKEDYKEALEFANRAIAAENKMRNLEGL